MVQQHSAARNVCVYATVVFNNLKSIKTCHACTYVKSGFKSDAQLTRFEAGQPASKRVKGCESGRNKYTSYHGDMYYSHNTDSMCDD